TIKMEQAGFALCLYGSLRTDPHLLLGLLPAGQCQPSEVELLIGSGVALVGHGGSLVSGKVSRLQPASLQPAASSAVIGLKLFRAFVLDLPLAAVEEGFPARRLAVDL